MCGIFGAVSLAGRTLRHPGCLGAMAAALAHRGPDGEQIVGHERARIGARRLAIMDLTTGDQPFVSPDRAVWMVCNGEIYNAPELRREFAHAGYPFRSTGDIETIVPLYERLGPDGVGRLDGMFGLAVWDDQRRRLVLARDRAGEKPLFWSQVGDELRFASELQALLVFPDQPRRVDATAAELYAALGYVPAPRTMFAGIAKLEPGHVLVAQQGGVTERCYWDAAAVAAGPSRLAAAATLRAALLQAVERELMSDVPVGVFTSGGLDSSLLAAAAARVDGESHDRIPAQAAGRGCGVAARGAPPDVVRRARAGPAHAGLGEWRAGRISCGPVPQPPVVARLRLVPARQPARQGGSRHDARLDRSARPLSRTRGPRARPPRSRGAQGAGP